MNIKITKTAGNNAQVSAISFDPVPTPPTQTTASTRMITQGASLGRLVGAMPNGTPIDLQYHTDAQGNLLALTDVNGNVVSGYAIDAWGNVISGDTTQSPMVYQAGLGYWHDPDLGMNYVRARWLDPTTGRWLSADPNLDELPYQYADNSPAGQGDKSGEGLEAHHDTRSARSGDKEPKTGASKPSKVTPDRGKIKPSGPGSGPTVLPRARTFSPAEAHALTMRELRRLQDIVANPISNRQRDVISARYQIAVIMANMQHRSVPQRPVAPVVHHSRVFRQMQVVAAIHANGHLTRDEVTGPETYQPPTAKDSLISRIGGYVDHHFLGDAASDFGTKVGNYEGGREILHNVTVSAMMGTTKLAVAAYAIAGLSIGAAAESTAASAEVAAAEAEGTAVGTGSAMSRLLYSNAMRSVGGIVARRVVVAAGTNILIGSGIRLWQGKKQDWSSVLDDGVQGIAWAGATRGLATTFQGFRRWWVASPYVSRPLRLVTYLAKDLTYSSSTAAENSHIIRQWVTDMATTGPGRPWWMSEAFYNKWIRALWLGGGQRIIGSAVAKRGEKELDLELAHVITNNIKNTLARRGLAYEPAFGMNPYAWWKGMIGQWQMSSFSKNATMEVAEHVGNFSLSHAGAIPGNSGKPDDIESTQLPFWFHIGL